MKNRTNIPDTLTLIPHVNMTDHINDLQKEVEDYRSLVKVLKRKNDIQGVLNSILQISLQSTTLVEQLDEILRLILSIEWLALEKKGAIFLKKDDQTLKLVTSQNLGESLINMCQTVRYGQCLCGKAAQSQKIVFKDCLDADHDNIPAGITEHGHYIIPIIFDNETLGVLNLYVHHGHIQTKDEVDFLGSCSNIVSGVVQRKLIEEQLAFLSKHDELTGLANRRDLLNELEILIKQSKRMDTQFAILFIDLDYFKHVNDTLGHKSGDLVLIEVAKRLKNSLRELDIIARNGGDEFIVVIQNYGSNKNIEKVGKAIIDNLTKVYEIEGKKVHIGASIGVSVYPNSKVQQEDIDGLIQLADEALYGAKTKRGTLIISDNN